MLSSTIVAASCALATAFAWQAAPTPAARPAAPVPHTHSHTPPTPARQAPPSEGPVIDYGDAIDALPPLKASPEMINMGVAAPKQGMSGSATLTNTGTKPLRIAMVTTSCKCTTIKDLAGTVIEPGASVALDAVLDPVSMPQTQKAVVRVLVEGYAQVLEVPVQGEVATPVRAKPSMINAVEGQPQHGRVLIESIDGKPFTICAIHGRKPEYIGFTPGTDEPRSNYLVKYNLDSWSPAYPAYLVVETDRPDCPVFDIWVRSERTIPRPGLRMKEYRLNAGRIAPGESATITVDMEDGGEEVLAVESHSKDVAVQLVGQQGDGKLRQLQLKVTPALTEGLVYAPITLYGREKDQPLILFASVRPESATGCTGCVAVDPPQPSTEPTQLPATR